MRDDGERILDILDSIKRIERYLARGREAFLSDELLQVWMVHHIQIIGEAAGKLSDSLTNAHREVPWPQIIAMRNILVHDYFSIDLDTVWATAETDIPVLKKQIENILRDMGKLP